MAIVEFNGAVVGLGIASTWGTAADISSTGRRVIIDSITLNDTYNSFDVTNTSNVINDIVALEQAVEVTLNLHYDYNGEGNSFIAALLGTIDGTPAEVNVSQGDYQHQQDFAATTSTLFTLVWKFEGDHVIELPTVRFHTLTFSGSVNQRPTISVTGTANRVISSTHATPTNTAAEVVSMQEPGIEYAVLNGANFYARLDAVANAPLTSGDDQVIDGFTYQITRSSDKSYTLNGSSTKYTSEPAELTAAQQLLTFSYPTVLADTTYQIHDAHQLIIDGTEMLAEVNFEGSQIGSGDNRTCKFQFPSLKAVSYTGLTPSRGQRLGGSITFKCLEAAAAPSGMTHTNTRQDLINTQSGAYSA